MIDEQDIERICDEVMGQTLKYKKEKKPNFFSGLPDEDVIGWIYRFNFLAAASNWDEAKILQKLPTFLDGTALDFYSLKVDNDPAFDTVEKVTDALKAHFLPSNYSVVLREELEKIKQSENESVSAFLLTVKKKCRDADPDLPENEIIRLMLKGMHPRISRQVFDKEPRSIAAVEGLAKQVETGYLLFAEKESKDEIELQEKMKEMTNEMGALLVQVREGKRDAAASSASNRGSQDGYHARVRSWRSASSN